jgi:ATP-dependent DNA ligase
MTPASFLYAFDLIELNGDDLRRDPLEVRKATLALARKLAPIGISEPVAPFQRPPIESTTEMSRLSAR